MQSKGIIQQISDILLKGDPAKADWLKEPNLRFWWHAFIVYIVFCVGIILVVSTTPLTGYLSQINNGAFGYRVFSSFFYLIGLFFLFILTFHYFKYTIEKGNSIKFENVIYFYFASIILFGMLYYFSFNAVPDFFQYDKLRIIVSPSLGSSDYTNWSTKFHFLLYSAFESVGGKFVYVQSNSVLVSIINYAQTLYSFSLVSLLIAGYINQKTSKSA